MGGRRPELQESDLADQMPLGVIGQIIPWNFRLLMLAWKIAPALSVGYTVVLKPTEFTSLTALLFAELVAQAGVLNVVTGDGTTGAALVDHPGVDKIAFAGSTEPGRWLQPTSTRSSRHPTSRQGSSTSLPAEAIAS